MNISTVQVINYKRQYSRIFLFILLINESLNLLIDFPLENSLYRSYKEVFLEIVLRLSRVSGLIKFSRTEEISKQISDEKMSIKIFPPINIEEWER